MSETPLRYPDPPDRDDEQTSPLPPFEPSPDEEQDDGEAAQDKT